MKYTERIKYIRKQKKLSQKEIAEKLNIKQQQYERYENEKNALPINYLIGICKILDISPEYILGFTNSIKSIPKQTKKSN